MADEKRQILLELLAKAKTKAGTKEAADDLDKLGNAAEDADEKTESLGKTTDETSKKTEKLGKDADKTKERIATLTDQIQNVTKELHTLHAAFADSSDAAERLDISKTIRKTENELRRLNRSKGVLESILPDPKEAMGWVQKLGSNISDGLSSLGSSIASNKYLLAGVVAGVTTISPLIAGVVGAAVIGGIGLGGIIGGIALAAKSDAQIQGYASRIGKSFSDRLASESRGAFSGVIMENLGKLEALADKAVGGIGKAFRNLAPSTGPFVDDLIKGAEVLGHSFLNATSKAGPVIDSLGKLFGNLEIKFAGFIGTMAAHSEDAADAVDVLSDILGFLIDTVTLTVGALMDLGHAIGWVGDQVGKARNWLEDQVGWLDLTHDGYEKGSEAAKLYREGVIGAAGSVNDYNHYLAGAVDSTGKLKDAHQTAAEAADAQKKAEQELTDQLRAQTDPAFGLLRAIDGVKESQKNAAEAAKKYGTNSTEAREATRKLAEAAINLQSAAGQAGGSLDGTLSPALRNTLKAAGLTKSQIAAVEKELKDAKKAAEAYEGTYNATFTTTFVSAYANKSTQGKAGNSRYPDEKRAAGGPAVRGRPYLVGENGPEIMIPDASGRVLSSAASRGLMVQAAESGMRGSGSGSGGGSAKATVTVNGGADQGVATLINYLIRTDKIQIQVSAE